MVWNFKQKLAVCIILSLLIALFISLFNAVNVNAVTLDISPTSGIVGDRITVTGVAPPNNNWAVFFDTNVNGGFESSERISYQNSGSSQAVSLSFAVPECIGSDVGVVHAVQLTTDFRPTPSPEPVMYLFVAAEPPYDPPFSASRNFMVFTARDFKVPASVNRDAPIPIDLTITGGRPNTSYNYRVEVTRPDGARSATTFITPTNPLGTGKYSLSYPRDFPSGNTAAVGSYNIAIQETAPGSMSYTTNVQVYDSSPTHNPPTASITSIQPNPTTVGTPVNFTGTGTASRGYVINAYRWTSNISGLIGSTSTFTTNTLPAGTHGITFEARDNGSSWSTARTTSLQINPGPTPSPTPSPGQPVTPTPTPSPGPPGSTPSPSPSSPTPPGPTPMPPQSNPTPGPSTSTTPTPGSSGGGGGGSSGGGSPGGSASGPTPGGSQGTSPSTPSPTNQPPTATITTAPPASISQGQSIIITGEGFDSDGTIVGYTWTSSLSGVVSTSPQLDTANLVAGTHQLTFQVTDDDNTVSQPISITLTVNAVSNSTPLLAGAAVGTATIVAVGAAGAAVWLHYSNLSSFKVKTKLWKKSTEQQTKEQNQDNQDKKKERNKKRPFLIFSESKVPQNILQQTPYLARFAIKNVGTDTATNITVHGLANPFVEYKDTPPEVPSLAPGETTQITLPFLTNADIRKNLYQVQFEVQSKQTEPKLKRCFMRGAKIAVLTDEEQLSQPVMQWLSANNYPFVEIHDATHLMTELYQYDLIIVSAQHDMPSKWVQNICTYVENGQSILLLDKISTSRPERLDEALGYHEEPDALDYGEAALEITKQHPITNGLSLGEHIPLGHCIGNAAAFTQATPTAIVLANNIDQSISGPAEVPIAAVMVKETGKGKIVHLNFHAQEHLNQIDRLVKNAVEWLLWD